MKFFCTFTTSSALIFACAVAILFSATLVPAALIPASRITNWQGNVGVEGGIPKRTTIYKTLGPASTAAQINAAIASCPANQVVKLNAGTYNLTGPISINRSTVTLRGAGPTQTILKFNGVGGSAFIGTSGGGRLNPLLITNWTNGYAQGTTSISVANATGFKVGDLVCLDQLNDPAYVGFGTEGATNSGQNFNRLQYQLTEITAISGNTVTISPGIYMPNYSVSRSPQMWNCMTGGTKRTYVGIEDLQVDGTGGGAEFNIFFGQTQNCWVKNCESINAGTAHVRSFRDKALEIRDSVMIGNRTAGVGAYSILLWTATQSLIENNICGPGTIIVQSGSTGCAVGYNYNYGISGGWMGYILANHNAHPAYNLYEGNVAPQIYADYIHGSSSYLTYFRNWLKGTATGSGSNTHAITIEMYNRYFNVVGNVLGNSSYHTSTKDVAPGTITETSVYKLGYRGAYNSTADSLVASTLLRHANYDAVNNAIVWDLAIADKILPDSLYLAGKPSWFGNLAWPPFSATKPNALASDIPAGARFANGANQLRNISARGFVRGGDGVLIGGFVITGKGQKKIALRGIGPSLPLSPALSNPMIELHAASGALLAQNDNWKTSQVAQIAATGLAPGNEREAALITTLNPGSYTVIVRGVGNATGIGLVEVYDLDASGGSTRLGNISTRGNVLNGSGVLIGGFIAGGGDWSPLVVVRAIGPSLANSGVANALADPTLDLRDANGALVASNDNWRDGRTSDITAAGFAPSDLREAAISTRLRPGNYTVVVSGKNGATGVGLVEIYSLPDRVVRKRIVCERPPFLSKP